MDTAPSERCIVIRIDGEGKLQWDHAGLSPIEILGLLAMVSHYAMTDLHLAEVKVAEDNALVGALKRMLPKAA